MTDFADCLNVACLLDLRYTGQFYTWSNRRFNRRDFTERKLDRVLVNNEWLDSFHNSNAFFKAPGISDHSPMIVDMGNVNRKKGIPFKFYNHWTSMENFDSVVANSWGIEISGTYQFQLCHKLRYLKRNLKIWAKDHFGQEKKNVDMARAALLECQSNIDSHPHDMNYRDEESDLMIKFLDAIHIEEQVAKQKARNHWLEVGDRNTKYFYNSIKGRRNRNMIVNLTKPDGTLTMNLHETKSEVVRYFENMLGASPNNNYPGLNNLSPIVTKRVTAEHFNTLSTIPDDEEIKSTLFSIHSNKAPGPDGFNAHFFKNCWSIVGTLVINVVKEFFCTGEIPLLFL